MSCIVLFIITIACLPSEHFAHPSCLLEVPNSKIETENDSSTSPIPSGSSGWLWNPVKSNSKGKFAGRAPEIGDKLSFSSSLPLLLRNLVT